MPKDQHLAGKHAIIMGLAADAAEPVALALAAAGADVALTTATNDAEEAFALRRITRGVRALGRQSMNESVDMSIGTGVGIAIRQIAKELGSIDIAVIGPDVRLDKPADRLTDADWSRLLNSNLSAVFFAARTTFREMRRHEPGGGRILIVLPAANDGNATYAAVRAGIAALAEALAAEWADSGVSVTSVIGTDAAALMAAVTV